MVGCVFDRSLHNCHPLFSISCFHFKIGNGVKRKIITY